jgi:hypothetical protein
MMETRSIDVRTPQIMRVTVDSPFFARLLRVKLHRPDFEVLK